jgi:spore coat protein U domain-containing protein, fimbrial subunit CupE1/2/3/6
MNKIIVATMAASVLVGAGIAKSSTTTANIAVNVTVQTNCLFTGGTVAATYLPGAGAVTASNASALTVACSPDTNTPTISFGTGLTGTIAQRLATLSGSSLQYNLYTSAAGTSLLGNGTTGVTVAVTGSTIAVPKAVPVYIIVPDNATNQVLAAGSYTDTVVATLTF